MRKSLLCFLAVAVLLFSGCNGGSKPILITITSPTGAQALDLGQSFTISVTVENDKTGKGVTFTLSGVGTLSNQSSTGATYTAPATGNGGTATITITSATDPTKTTTITITVTPPPAISNSSPTLTGGVQGATYSATVTTSGGAGTLTYSVTIGNLPPGLTLNSSTGAISGTPTGTGTFTFTVQVKDSSTVSPQSSTKQFTITVNEQPTITSANTTTFVAGTAGSFQVTTTAIPTAALTESGALPSGITFVDNGNGTATLAGTTSTTGTFPITINANNGIGTAATQNFSLIIAKAPAITSSASATFTAGTAATPFSVTTTGYPAPALSESGALPSGVTFTDNKNGTATLAGTPAANSGGKYTFTITASNGTLPNATQSFTLTVDQAPAISSANSANFTINVAGTSFTVATTGYPAPALSETGPLPAGVTFTDNHNGTATISGTPTASGAFPITITANNGITPNATQSFTLNVDQPPAISSGASATFIAGTAATPFSVTTTGYPAPALSESGALPSGVTFTDNKNGTATIAGTPAANSGGKYTFTITAGNGTLPNATQSFTLTVNQVPAITSVNAKTFSVGAAGTFNVTTTGYPTPALSESGALPSGVTFTDNGNGTATISGTASASGSFPFVITASNGVLPNATQNFTLTVNTAPAFTSANNASFTVGISGTTFTVSATGTPTPSFSESPALPSGLSFHDNGNGTATLSGTPASGTGGIYTLTITAANTAGSTNQTFTLTIDQAPTITTANSTTFTVGSNSSFTVMTTGVPKPALSESGATLPSGVTFTDNGDGTATLAGTPASGTAGTYTFTITANNGVTPNATQSFTLSVNTAPVFSSANNTTFTVGTMGSFTVAASGSPTFTVSSGTLPSGVTLASNGTLSGTPAAGTGKVYMFTIKATNGTGSTTQNFTLTVDEAPYFTSSNVATFTLGQASTFSVAAGGYPAPTLSQTTGTLPNGVTFTAATGALAGTPATGTAGTYPITFTASNGIGTNATQNFTLTVVTSACTGSGTGSESLLNGQYAFVLKGFDNGLGTGETQAEPVLVGGILIFNGTNNNGQITAGTIDMNTYSSAGIATQTVTGGTYTVGSDHRACFSIVTAQGTQDYRASLGNISGNVASLGHMIGFDSTGPFVTGTLRKQTITQQLSGNFAFGVASVQNSNFSVTGSAPFGGANAFVGILDFQSGGSITGGELDGNQNGFLDGNASNTSWPTSPISISPTGANYSIASNGRGTMSFTPEATGASTVDAIIYVVSSTDILALSSDDQTQNSLFTGEAIQQSGTPFSSNPLSGTYVGYDSGLGSATGFTRADIILLGPLTSGSATLSGSQIKNHSGNISTGTISGTYQSSSAGRIVVADGGPVLYLVSASSAFYLNDNGPVDFGLFQLQSGSPFSSSSINGTYAFGTINPDDPSVTDEDGVATFTSDITGTSDDNSNGSQSPGNTFGPQTYSVSSAGLGLSPSGCTVGGSGASGCQIAFYIISPNSAVFIQLQNGSGTTNGSPAIETADK